MKLPFLLLALPLFAVAQDLDLPEDFVVDPNRPHHPHIFSAYNKYIKAKSVNQAKYRAGLADALKHADGIEILLLNFIPVAEVPEGKEEKYFSLLPDGSHTEILDQKRLSGEKLAQCREATVKLLQEENDWGGGALCHMPIHGIRLFRGQDLIFETSICWKCINYYIKYPDDFDTATWVGFKGKLLKEFLMKEMPIPKSEMKRFEAIYGKKEESPDIKQDGSEQPANRPESK